VAKKEKTFSGTCRRCGSHDFELDVPLSENWMNERVWRATCKKCGLVDIVFEKLGRKQK
jgi:ribosomal protein L37E